MKILGVDPGVNGGLAVVKRTQFGLCEVHDCTRMPKVPSTGRGFELNVVELARWLKEHARFVDAAVVEKVQAGPMDGRASAFKFGRSAGLVEGMVAMLGHIVVIRPTPSKWKRDMNLNADKGVSLAEAARRHPDMAQEMSVKANDGIAEAILLAHYGFQSLGGSHGS